MATVTNEASAGTSLAPLLDLNADTAPPIVPFRSAERYAFIDALRGLAVVLMVEQHLGIWLTAVHAVGGGLLPALMAFNALGGAAAPLFVLLAGVGIALGSRLSGLMLVRRGLALAVCAYLLNLACPSWFSPGSFYVLHLIACFWLLAPALRRLADAWLLVAFGCSLLLTVWVQTVLQTPPMLFNPRLRDTTLPLGALRLALAEGHFPLLPWLAFAILGIWTGRRIASKRTKSLYVLAGTLLAAFVMGRVPVLFLRPGELRRLPLRSLVNVTFYPPSVGFVLALSGAVVLLLALAGHWDPRGRFIHGWLVPLGRTSLTLLCVHVVLFREGSLAIGVHKRLDPVVTLGIIAAVLAGWALLARVWSRVDYRYSLEWWIRTAGGRAPARQGSPAQPSQDLPR
jgi:uncharacterized membrane protein